MPIWHRLGVPYKTEVASTCEEWDDQFFNTYAHTDNVKFFDMVDESVWQNLSNSFTLFNSKAYQDMRNFSEDYEVSINGTDVIKKDKSKKIA